MTDLSNQGQRILAVDDDPFIRTLLVETLAWEGYQMLTARSGEEALKVIHREGLPHLAIVDINMPGISGLELCQSIHTYADLPIIMLTAVNEEETVVRSIKSFAEDYINKPFRPRELVARVQRVLRRVGDLSYGAGLLTEVDDHLSIDFAHQRAILDGQEVCLTATETKLLYVLVRSTGRFVTTAFILRRLWPMEERFEDALRVHVHRLRRKIEPDPREPRYIVTERGVGYCFTGSC